LTVYHSRVLVFAILWAALVLGSYPINASDLSLVGLPVSIPLVRDLAGDAMDSIKIGQQAIIEVSITNGRAKESPFVIIVEVRDGSGVTMALYWQRGEIAVDGNYTMGASWRPEVACSSRSEGCANNVIRAFVVSDLDQPQVLSEVRETTISVTGTPPAFIGTYFITFNGTSYDGKYTTDSGKIVAVAAHRYLTTMTISLDGIYIDGYLTIEVPRSVAAAVFSCEGLNLMEPQPEKFTAMVASVDGRQTTINLVDDSPGSLTWNIQLPAGSREAELIATCLL
jgi:hypothetical protein